MAASAKIGSFFVLFVMTLSFGLLPFILIKCLQHRFSKQRIKYYISMLNCFSGGVFFGTAILHLLPEAMEQVEDHIESDYPVTSALIGAGFLLVLFAEHVVGSFKGGAHFGHSHLQDENESNQLSASSFKSKDIPDTHLSVINTNSAQSTSTTNGQATSIGSGNHKIAQLNGSCQIGRTANLDEHDEGNTSKLRTSILVLALSLHMTFEGLAVGLQDTNQEVWELVGILTLHKCIVAFSTGLHLEETLHSFKKVLISIIGFSLVAPLGVGIGFLITEYGGEGHAQGVASGVLQSLATGTFFYITFFEILQKELANTYNLLKVLYVVVGFLIIIGVQFMPDKD